MDKLTFSTVTFVELSRVVSLTVEVNDDKFAEWLPEQPELDSETISFLSKLAHRHRKNLMLIPKKKLRPN